MNFANPAWTSHSGVDSSSSRGPPGLLSFDEGAIERVQSVEKIVTEYKPDYPVFLFRPHRLRCAAEWFTQNFPGETFYAVKANPAPHVLNELWHGGIRGFDVASLTEIELVHSMFPNAKLAFMHPVKNRNVIRKAYHEFGVRRFVLDSFAELDKIVSATNSASDLTLIVRLDVPSFGSAIPLTTKFGADACDAPKLLRACRKLTRTLGVSFHVGSQALKPEAYAMAVAIAAERAVAAGTETSESTDVQIDIVDVGGGFPVHYTSFFNGMHVPPALKEYTSTIVSSIKQVKAFQNASLWCEPGRALSGEGEGLLTRIEGVKLAKKRNEFSPNTDNENKKPKPAVLYINDGSFGALYDVVHEQWRYPVRAVTAAGKISPTYTSMTSQSCFAEKSFLSGFCDLGNDDSNAEDEIVADATDKGKKLKNTLDTGECISDTLDCSRGGLVPYVVYGPTCDSADKLPSTVLLPAGLEEGDYLEWGNIGGYGRAMATGFNGYGCYETVRVADSPWPSLFGDYKENDVSSQASFS